MPLLNCKAVSVVQREPNTGVIEGNKVDFDASWKDLETSLFSLMSGMENALNTDDWLRLYT